MAGGSSDHWRNLLGKHDLFTELRQNANTETSKLCRTLNKNFFFSIDGDFFAWDDKNGVLYTTSLRKINTESSALSDFKTLLCINPPLFEVDYLLVNPSQHYVALVGARGLTVLAVPQRWGKRSEFEGGKSKINCRTIPVAERLFTSSSSLVLRHAAWYPDESEEPYLVLLLSDNILRLYSLKEPHSPAKTLSLSQSEEHSMLIARGSSYTASLGEIAVAFDFGPVVEVSAQLLGQKGKANLFAYPLYILYENGETSLTYVSISHGSVNLAKLLGPLPMYPPAEDNYGYDACAILCLSHVPNVLVIATESGLLYHCVVLEAEDDDDQTSTESWDSKLELIPSLYVFECVTLELALKLAPGEDEHLESDFTCPIKLHRDPLCSIRYHCTHEAGVHSVGLMWISKLQKYIQSGDEDKDSLQELAAEQKCIVEHILCTKPLPCRQPSPIKGFLIIPDLSLGATLICVTSTYECISRPLLTVVRPISPPLLCSEEEREPVTSPLKAFASDSFEKHIRNILSRVSANPVFIRSSDKDNAPPPQECLQLLSRATQVFREEYILKQDLAKEEIQRRVKFLCEQKDKQLEDLNHCREEKKNLREMAERLAEKFEEAREKQDDLIRRMKKVLHSFHMQLPVLSDSEKDMKKELQTVNDQLRHLENKIRQIKVKMEYQKKQMDKQDIPRKASTPLSAYQKKCIQSVLKEEGERIAEMIKQINDIKNRVTF